MIERKYINLINSYTLVRNELRCILKNYGGKGMRAREKGIEYSGLNCCQLSELGIDLNEVLSFIEGELGLGEFYPEEEMITQCSSDYPSPIGSNPLKDLYFTELKRQKENT